MDFSNLRRSEAIGALASLALVLSLALPWFSLSHGPERVQQNAWLCGTNDYSCAGFETFPILRWLLLAAASAPLILAWIVIRGQTLSWPPGEMTMVVGFTAFVLVAYNGIVSKPGSFEFGIGLSAGYWLALLSTIAMAAAGASRSLESGGGAQRKPAGTI
jgi:hypothetical protein